jgi:hypothetical protein
MKGIHLSVAALLNGPRLWRSPAAVRFQRVPGAQVRSFGAHLTVAVTTAGPVFSLFQSKSWHERERRVQLHRYGLAVSMQLKNHEWTLMNTNLLTRK